MHGLRSSDGLKMPIHAHIWVILGILTSKVAQSDLVFSLQSQFINMSLHARLQVSVCSGYDLYATLVNIQTHTDSIVTSLYDKLRKLR